MSNRNLPRLVVLALLALAVPASAHWDRTALIINVPTADVLPRGSLAVSANLSHNGFIDTHKQYKGFEAGGALRFAPIDRLELALTMYTLTDYVLGASYRLLGAPGGAGLAIGIHDVGLSGYVSPVGRGLDSAKVWPDWMYNEYRPRYDRPMENFSAFAVTSVPVAGFTRLHLGLGRGRYVGYDAGRYVNTDIFLDEPHQWAIGLFGGLEVDFGRHVTLGVDVDGRDLNAGLKFTFGPVSAAVAATKLEGFKAEPKDRFGRFDLMVAYQFDNLFRRRVPAGPVVEPFEPEPEPEPLPPVVEPSPEVFKLFPIWFEWDKWDITVEAAATLRENAKVLLAYPDVKVLVAGYASEEGTLAHNIPLSGRRARAAFEYLRSLGVPAEQMRDQGMGESAGYPLPMHRTVEFRVEPEK